MRILKAIALMSIVAGCERAQTAGPTSQPAGDPQTSSARIEASKAPTTAPVERTPSVVLVEQKPISFPPAVLQLRTRDGQLSAVLMSDDPKDAIDDNYHGNSFYLEMPLQVSDVKDLPNFVYPFVASGNEKTDSLNGIFLDGNRIQLQPQRMQVKFEGAEPSMTVTIAGDFNQIDTRDDNVPVKSIHVMARLEAEVKKK